MKKKSTRAINLCFYLICSSFLFTNCTSENEISEVDELNIVSAKASSKKDYMVILKNESIPEDFILKLEDLGATVSSYVNEIGVISIKSTENISKKINSMSDVRSVVPDLNVRWIDKNFYSSASPLSIGSDEQFFSYLWGMDAIDAPEAWNHGFTGSGVRVAVLDSGIDAEHPDLAPNLNTTLSASFIEGEDWNVREEENTYFNHGTHVAGTIAAADNQIGVIGVAPNAEIVAVKVLSEYSGSGPFSSINAGIVYAALIGADVINMSLGASFDKNGFIELEDGSVIKVPGKLIAEIKNAQQRAINFAYKNGVTIIASAGNSGNNYDGNGPNLKLPAGLNNVISVSATAPLNWAEDNNTDLDLPASYTDYGKSLVTIAGPGGDSDSESALWYLDMVLSTIPGGWSWSAGTSMASPHVSGVAALIIGKNGGKMNPHEVTKQLVNTADKIDGNGASAYYGKGRVNALRAITE